MEKLQEIWLRFSNIGLAIGQSRAFSLCVRFARRTCFLVLSACVAILVATVILRILLFAPSFFYPFFMFPFMRVIAWVGLSIAIAYGIWSILSEMSNGQERRVVTASFFVFYLSTPHLTSAYYEFARQKDAWLAAKCIEINSSPIRRHVTTKIPIEGYVDKTNYDILLNSRFQRNAGAIEKNYGGGTRVYDLNDYVSHAIFRMRGHGGEFRTSAYKLLTENGLSYYEVEMLENGFDNSYSNSGLLAQKEWRGNRYRLYYLVPKESDFCKPKFVKIEGGIHYYSQLGSVVREGDPFCLVMEITEKSISKYALVADEKISYLRWTAHIYGVAIPSWVRVRLEKIWLLDIVGNKELASFEGFNYPNDVERKHACSGPRVLPNVASPFVASEDRREFLREKNWYMGSSVQRFYKEFVDSTTP